MNYLLPARYSLRIVGNSIVVAGFFRDRDGLENEIFLIRYQEIKTYERFNCAIVVGIRSKMGY